MTTLEKIEQIDKWLEEYEATDIYDLIEKVISPSKDYARTMFFDIRGAWLKVAHDYPNKTVKELAENTSNLLNLKLTNWEERLKDDQ